MSPTVFLTLAVLLQNQPPHFPTLAARPDTRALRGAVQAWPDEARNAVLDLLLAATGPDRDSTLSAAARIASVFASVHLDSLMVHRVALVAGLNATDHRTFVRADSLRRVGNAVLYDEGTDAAIRAWRASRDLAASIGDSVGIGAALSNLGAGLYVAGRYDSAVVYLEQARTLAVSVGDLVVEGNTVVLLGNVADEEGRLREASDYYNLAVRLHRRAGNAAGLASDYNNLGLIAEGVGDIDRAGELYNTALASNRQRGADGPAADNLMNLGNLALLLGRHDSAASRYREAIRLYDDAGQPLNAADGLYNLGLLQTNRADYRAAGETLRDARGRYRSSGWRDGEIQAHLALTTVHMALGEMEAALADLRSAESVAQQGATEDPELLAEVELTRGDVALQFNLREESQQAYNRAGDLFAAAGDPIGGAQVREGRALLALVHDEPKRALAELERVRQTYLDAGQTRNAAWAALHGGHAALAARDTARARQLFSTARLETTRAGDVTGEALAVAGLGSVSAETGRPMAAREYLQTSLSLLADRVAPNAEWQIRTELAKVHDALGETSDARAQYQQALTVIESAARRLRGSERRTAYLDDKWQTYRALARLEHRSGNPGAAFAVSERLRARQMLEVMANGPSPSPASSDRSQIQRERSLRERIAALTSRLEGPVLGEANLRGPDLTARFESTLREALVDAQAEYARMLRTMRETEPKSASTVFVEPRRAEEVQAALASDEALLEYLLDDNTLVIFAVTAQDIVSVEVDIEKRRIAGLVDFARSQLEQSARGDSEDTLWENALRRLYERLIEPVVRTAALEGKSRLIVVPHGVLHYIPFEALFAPSGRFLVEDYDVQYAPSASVWLDLPADPVTLRHVIAMAPRGGTLPGAREEVQTIGRLFGNRATVLTGSAARKARLVEEGSRYDVIHLASYAVLNKQNPMFSYLEMAGGGTEESRLNVLDVFGLRLNARLVVLSACQTGLGSGALADVPEGDDWVGLHRAFLTAGADRVIGTLWAVEDRASAAFMELFYGDLKEGASVVSALSQAKREALRDPKLRHPYYWAAYVLVGAS